MSGKTLILNITVKKKETSPHWVEFQSQMRDERVRMYSPLLVWLCQHLQKINEAVLPLHPVVPNVYTLFSEISEQAKYFSVIDLKGGF